MWKNYNPSLSSCTSQVAKYLGMSSRDNIPPLWLLREAMILKVELKHFVNETAQ